MFQKRWLIPLCFMISLAVNLDLIFPSTVTLVSVIGLYQMSWSPFPCLTKLHPFFFKISLTFFSYSAIGKHPIMPFGKESQIVKRRFFAVQFQ